MSEQVESDAALKATNNSLTPPEADLKEKGRDYPPSHREKVSVGRSDVYAPPGYGAGARTSLDPDADPAAPTAQGGPIVPLDPASDNRSRPGPDTEPGADNRDDEEGGWVGTPNDLAPGALTTNPDAEDVSLVPGAMSTNANAPVIGGRITGDPNHVDAGDPRGGTESGRQRVGEFVANAGTHTSAPADLVQGTSPQLRNEPQSPMPPQHQGKPGLENELNPRPRYMAPLYKAAGKLLDKVALITGGDSGIGRAVAALYAREGAHVAIVFLESEMTDALETQRAVESHGRKCLLIPGDLTDARFCRAAVEMTVQQLGKLDILVSNAGYQNRKSDISDVSFDEFDTTFKTNIYAYFHLAQAAVGHMPPGSAIIATGSEAGTDGSKQLLDYSASKGAIHAFTKALAQQLTSKGIRVNAVAPGPVWTPLNVADQGMSAKEVGQFGAKTPMGRPRSRRRSRPLMCFWPVMRTLHSSPESCWKRRVERQPPDKKSSIGAEVYS